VPAGGDPNQITTYDLRGANFCTEKGFYIDFTDEGGFDPAHGYPNGVPYQVFGHVTGSATRQHVVTSGGASDIVNNGQELLMQVVVAGGPDASPLCPGGTSTNGGHLPGQGGSTPPPSGGGGTTTPPPGGGTTTPVILPKAIVLARTPRIDAKRRNVRLALRCTGTKPCKGRTALKVTRRIGTRKRTLGFAFGTFTLSVGQTKTVSAKLTTFGRSLVKKSARIKGVSVTAFTYTSAGGNSSTRTLTVKR